MLSGEGRALVYALSNVRSVVEQDVQVATINGPAALGAHALISQGAGKCRGGPDLHETLEDHADRRGFRIVYDQLAVLHLVAEGRVSAHPHATRPRCSDLVAY